MGIAKDDSLIRPARADDLESLPAIERAASQVFRGTKHEAFAEASGMDLADFEHWFKHGAIWVAETNGKLVGFAVAEALDGEGFLTEMDVLPEHARKGLGKQFIQLVREWGAAQGYREIRLITCSDIPWNAPFYRRVGFRILEESELSPALLREREEDTEDWFEEGDRVLMTISCT
jgi:GNAT superfamily N-acetyltransferase